MKRSSEQAMVRVVMRYPVPKEWQFPAETLVQVILERLGINPESVLVIAGETILTPDQAADGLQEIEILPVVSGGTQQ